MRKLTILAGLLLLAGEAHAGAESLVALLPEDTAAWLRVEDAPGLRDAWDSGALKTLWEDPRIENFVGVISDDLRKGGKGEDDEDWDLLRRLLGEATGEIVIAASTLGSRWDDAPGVALLMTVAGDDAVWARLRDAAEEDGSVYGTRKYRGLDVRVGEDAAGRDDDAWGVVGKTAVFADSYTALTDLVDAALDGRPANVTSSPLYRQTDAGSDLLLVVNLRRILSGYREELVGEIEEDEAFVNGDALWTAMGLDTWEGLIAGVDLEAGRITMRAGVLAEDGPGLIRLWPDGVLPPTHPMFLPGRALWYSEGMLDLKDWWEALLGMAAAVDPSYAALLHGQIRQLAVAYGVDFEEDVLRSLGSAYYVAGYPGDHARRGFGGSPELIVLPVRNRAGVENLLGALHRGDLGEILAWESRTIRGTEVFVASGRMGLPDPVGANRPAYAMTDHDLLVALGGADVIEDALALLQEPGTSLWDDPRFTAAVEDRPQDATTLSYLDTPALLEYLIRSAAESSEAADLPDPGPAVEAVREHLGPLISWSWNRRVQPDDPAAPSRRLLQSLCRLVVSP